MPYDNLLFSMEDLLTDPLIEKIMDKSNNNTNSNNIINNNNITNNITNNINGVKNKNKKRKITKISSEDRYENNIPIPFFESIEDEINHIKSLFTNKDDIFSIKYEVKSMPIGAIFEYNNMIYKLIRYNNETGNVVVQLLKEGLLNNQKILVGQVIEIYGSYIGLRIFNYETNN